MFVLVSACTRNLNYSATSLKQPTQNCRKVEHLMGKTCIPLHPQRVVTLWSSFLADILALGIKPIATGYDSSEPFPEYLREKVDGVDLIGSENEPNLEKILLLKPDLILAHPYILNVYYKQISTISPTVIIGHPNLLTRRWDRDFVDLGKVLNKEEAVNKLMKEYWQRIEKLKQALGSRRHQIQVSVASIKPLSGIWSYGEKSPVGTVLNDIGLKRPSSQRGNFFYIGNISEERLSDIDGDVLFFLSWGSKSAKETLEKLQKKPLWRQLKAVQRNQVYLVDGLRWHEGDIFAINAIIDDLFRYLIATP
ncbi:iron-siderophore ABC transporter substrate-binding protein [Nostoc sp.]|uniref:iron-siderophore ABC transporter substrate-binding protein n=1 Tax=Nostoc sp. TaxID=1180 RepID=UPI002FFA2B52